MNYKLIHDSIIDRAKNSNRFKKDGNYYEAHHIVPKCMGGKGKETQWRTHPNIVLLTAKEHIIIHSLLCEIYPDNHKLIHAYWLLANTSIKKDINYRVGAKEYERLKIKHSEITSVRMTGKNNHMFGRTGEKNHMFGRTGEKNPLFGIKRSKEVILKFSGENHPMFGKKCDWVVERNKSEKSRQKRREQMIGKNNPMFGRTGENHPNFGKTGENNGRSRKVICVVTNKIYCCIKDAAEDNDVNVSTLRNYLRGNRPNKTSLRYL